MAEELLKISHNQFAAIFNETVALLVPPDQKVFHKSIEVAGDTLYFVDIDKLTTAEFADLDVISVDPMRDGRLHELLAILYRPQGEAYDWSTCSARAEGFKELPMEVAVGAGNFFFEFARVSISDGLNSLATQVPKEMAINLDPILKMSLPEIGSLSSWSSQEKILSEWTQQVNSQLQELLTTLPGSGTKPPKRGLLQRILIRKK